MCGWVFLFVYRGVWMVGWGKYYILPLIQVTYLFFITAMCGVYFGRGSTFCF